MKPARGFVAGLLVLLASAAAARGQAHQDPDLGYQIQPPRGWKNVPIGAEERWIVAKYVGDREYATKKDGWLHTPEMRVLFFPSATEEEKGVDTKDLEKGESFEIRMRKSYGGYRDWLKDNSEGGYFVEKEDETSVGSAKATALEIKFEKLTVPRRILAYVFHGEYGDYAVQFEGLSDYWDKLAPEFLGSIRTFKLLAREAAPEAKRGGSVEIRAAAKTPEERAKRRQEAFEKELATAVARLPKGWSVRKSKNYTALSSADDKFAQKVLDQCEGIRAWLEKQFGWVGDGKAGPVLVRVCANRQEASAYSRGSDDAWGTGYEATTFREGTESFQKMANHNLNMRILSLWFRDKNPTLAFGLPDWARAGLDGYVMTCVAKGGRIDPKPEPWELDKLREIAKEGKVARARDIVRATGEEFRRVVMNRWQAGALVRYLLDGPGAKDSRTKGAFENYLRACRDLVAEEEKKDEKAPDLGTPAKSEEEEEERFKQQRERWKSKEKRVLDEAFARGFGHLSAEDWSAVERAYAEYVD